MNSKKWWSDKRVLYNFGLISSGIISFVLYVFLGIKLIMPHDNDFEITLFTMFFQAVGFIVMLVIANILYYLEYFVDKNYNKENNINFRENLFYLGFGFSIFLPMIIPIMIIITYFLEYA